jgi:hypothetical protein
MGWKSTLRISRKRAIETIMDEYLKIYRLSNEDLGDLMDSMFGDDINKPYYGYNFYVKDKVELGDN